MQNSPALSILALPIGIRKSELMASSDISNCTPYMTSFSKTITETKKKKKLVMLKCCNVIPFDSC